MKKISILIFSLLLFACKKDDQKIEFTVVLVNDVYEITSMSGGKVGGLSRVTTVVNELKQENENTFLVHAGDFLNPSLIGTLKDENGERYRGKQMIEVMNAMNFDLVAIGNHEFDLSYSDLQKRFNESTFQWISTNPMLKQGEKNVPFYKMKDSVKENFPRTFTFNFKDKDGTEMDLGFFSATIPSNPKRYVFYGDMYQDAINAYNTLEPKTDLVLGLTHVSLNQDKLIANSLPNVPLILGGHEHTNMLIPVGDAVISKADANAKSIYIHRITFDKKTKETKIKSELKMIDDTIADDPKVAKVVSKWKKIMDDKLSDFIDNPYEIIYTTDVPLDGKDTPIRSKQTNLGVMIAESMMKGFGDSKIDCAIVNGGSIRIDDELSGAITGVDIFRVLPYGGPIYKVDMKGELLERVLQFGRLKSGTGAYLQRFNTSYDESSKRWKVGEKFIQKNKVYTVALTDYLLLGFDIPFLKSDTKGIVKVYPNNPDDLATDIRSVVIEHMSNL